MRVEGAHVGGNLGGQPPLAVVPNGAVCEHLPADHVTRKMRRFLY